MNKQQQSNERSLELHKVIAEKIRRTPSLWQIPRDNIDNWKKRNGRLLPAMQEWEHILKFPRLSGQGVKQGSYVQSYLDFDSPSMNAIGVGCKT